MLGMQERGLVMRRQANKPALTMPDKKEYRGSRELLVPVDYYSDLGWAVSIRDHYEPHYYISDTETTIKWEFGKRMLIRYPSQHMSAFEDEVVDASGFCKTCSICKENRKLRKENPMPKEEILLEKNEPKS